jgi:hypothetical protein
MKAAEPSDGSLPAAQFERLQDCSEGIEETIRKSPQERFRTVGARIMVSRFVQVGIEPPTVLQRRCKCRHRRMRILE